MITYGRVESLRGFFEYWKLCHLAFFAFGLSVLGACSLSDLTNSKSLETSSSSDDWSSGEEPRISSLANCEDEFPGLLFAMGDRTSESLTSSFASDDLPSEFLVVVWLFGERLSYKLGLLSFNLEYSSSKAALLLMWLILIILSWFEWFSIECIIVRDDFGDVLLSLIETFRVSSDIFLRDHFLFFLCSFHLELSAMSSSSSESYSSICNKSKGNFSTVYVLKRFRVCFFAKKSVWP